LVDVDVDVDAKLQGILFFCIGCVNFKADMMKILNFLTIQSIRESYAIKILYTILCEIVGSWIFCVFQTRKFGAWVRCAGNITVLWSFLYQITAFGSQITKFNWSNFEFEF
jgi:hypothetical protein